MVETVRCLQVLTDIVELLTGKTVPGTVKSFSHDKSRAAEQLLQHYQAILRFLECHCALMNSVLAEHLLDQTTLEQLLDLREARASTDADTRACQLWCASVSCSPTCQSTRKLDSRWKQVCPWNRGGHALKLRQGLSCQGTWCRRNKIAAQRWSCLLYTSPSPRDRTRSRMPSSA